MKKLNKSHLFILFMFMIGFTLLSFRQPINVLATGETTGDELSLDPDIQIVIGQDQNTPQSTYGEDVKIDIPLINEGKEDATNVVITPILDSSSEIFPYEINKMNYNIKVGGDGNLPGKNSKPKTADRTKTVSYNFTTRDDVNTGYVKVSFLITYKTPQGLNQSTTKDIFVKTIGAPTPTQAPVEPEAPLLPETPFEPELPFDPGPMPDPEQAVSVPRVIVSGYKTQPAEVKAGEQFKLTLHITNTSEKTSVNNLEFSIKSEAEGADPATAADAFMPVSGSSTIFLKSIGKEETKDIVIDMTAKADLSQKPYVINVDMKYEDSKVNQYTSDSSVSIPVKQEARVEVNEPQVMPNAIMVGQESNVMFSVFNTGKTKIYNTSVKFQSDSISGGEAFAGNIEPGETANIDTMLVGQVPSTDDGIVKLLITYEDEAGKQSTIEKEITLFVNEAIVDEEFPIFPDEEFPEEENSPKGGGFIKAIIILIIIIAVVIVILRRRKMKKEGFEDEIY